MNSEKFDSLLNKMKEFNSNSSLQTFENMLAIKNDPLFIEYKKQDFDSLKNKTFVEFLENSIELSTQVALKHFEKRAE